MDYQLYQQVRQHLQRAKEELDRAFILFLELQEISVPPSENLPEQEAESPAETVEQSQRE